MRAWVALVIAAAVALPSTTSAQTFEVCEAAWLDADHVRALLQVELAERWDPAFDATLVRVEACETERPRVSLIVAGREPTTLTLRLDAIAPRARTRFVALIVAELLRAQTTTSGEPAGETDGSALGGSPLPSAEPAAPPSTSPGPAATEVGAPARDVPELDAPASDAPAPSLPASTVGAEALAPPASRITTATVARSAPTAPASGPTASAMAEDAAPSGVALDAPEPSASPWRLGVGASVRVFVPPVVPAALVDVSLRYDRLLVAIAGGGTELGSPAGTVRMAQLTLGVGVRLLEHRGLVRVGWDVRGDAGAAMSAGDRSSLAIDGHVTLTYVLAASTQLEVVWPVSPIELGFTTDLGYQRGIVELGPFAQGGLGGAFASFGGTIAWSL